MWGIGLILLLAAILRMGLPGLTEFKADEARLFTLALEMVETRTLAMRGIDSSVGFPNAPMSVWLYALPLFLWRHIYAATLFTGLLNTVAVAICYGFARRYWGARAAAIAALLFAVSPWAVLFSRKIWAQNLLPFFVILWGVSAVYGFIEGRSKFVAAHLLLLSVVVQIHFAGISLIPVTIILILLFWRRINWKSLFLGAVLGILTAAPFYLYLWRNGFSSAQLPSVGEAANRAISWAALQLAAMITVGSNIHSIAGPEAFQELLARLPDMRFVFWLWGGLWLLSFVYLLVSAGKERKSVPSQAVFVLLLWMLISTVFFLSWQSSPVVLHYFIPLLPAPYIAIGICLDQIWKKADSRWLTAFGLALVGISAVFQFWSAFAVILFVGRYATPGGFGAPAAHQLQAARHAKGMLASTDAVEILVMGEGEHPLLNEFPAVWQALLGDTPHRFVDAEKSALFPAMPAIALRSMADISEGDLYHNFTQSAHTVPYRQGESGIQLFYLPGNARQPQNAFDETHLLANWTRLLGYDSLQIDGEEAAWVIYWQAADNAASADYHIFNHLINGKGERVAQADAAAFSPLQWRAGDHIASHFTLPWSPTYPPPLKIRVGMYEFSTLEAVLLLDVAGNPYTDAIEIDVTPKP